MFKFFNKFFPKSESKSERRDVSDFDEIRKHRREALDSWSKDMRRSHPCPLCLKKCTWLGKLCDNCQEKLDLWCPCDSGANYWDAYHKKEVPSTKRAPLPDWICYERCNRCGMRIKTIWLLMEETDGTENDDAIDKLVEQYEAQAKKDNDDFISRGR